MNEINPIDVRVALEMSKQLERDIGIIYERLEAMKEMSHTMTGILERKLTAVKQNKEEK